MARADEGQHIGAHGGLIEARPCLRVAGGQKPGQEVMGLLALRLRLQPAPPGRHDVLHRAGEEAQGGVWPTFADARRPIRRPEDVEGMHPPDGLEIGPHGAGEDCGVAGQTLGEDGALQHIKGHAGHFGRYIKPSTRSQRGPPGLEPGRRLGHGGQELGHSAGGEERGQRPPLHAPVLPLGGEDPIAQPRA